MQSFLTLALLFGSTLAAPLNADQNEIAGTVKGAVGLEKRQTLPRSVIQIIDLGNGEDSEASTTDAFVETTATSTTAFGVPTVEPFGSTDESQQPDPAGPISGLDKRQLDALTGLLGGLKPVPMSKRQLDALTGLLGGLKPVPMNKRQLDALTSLLGGLRSDRLNKRQLDAVTGLLGPLLGGLGGLGGASPAVPPSVPVPGATTTADATTTATGAISTASDAVPTNLEEFPTFGP
ncbi:hypothetical protein FNAPI_5180 [Fusarium napiforme]|uniref:Uncharacterized protein n=1 Tax=Fusarium napiforme TaxID=42672 RepID=A0A8H5JMR3_9HYPO|nr:hypothetical protein FNAPI_5180 [Fusarium napiforme]